MIPYSQGELKLIENCYSNDYNFNLKKFHIIESSPSDYHLIDGRPLELNDLSNQKINLDDGLSENFKLINYNRRNYLLGEQSCYPCSRVYQNIHGYRWVNILILPKGKRITIHQQKSIVQYNFLNIYELYASINKIDILRRFYINYISTFSDNEWFSKEQLIQIIKRSALTYSQIMDFLFEEKLLNPFQLSLYSIVNELTLTNQILYYSLLVNNDINLGITYLTTPTFKIKFSMSTEIMIDSEIFKNYIYSLDVEEINLFFEVDYLSSNIDCFYSEILLDVLSIKDIERAEDQEIYEPAHIIKPMRLKKSNITPDLIKEYYTRLKHNLRSLENKIRKSKGINLVGSLYNESLLFKTISENFPHLTLISQYSPSWLGRQRFDIYIKEYNTAIEYNGKQHYEPIDFYGGTEGFQNTLLRDEAKRRKCKENSCKLIEVKYNEDFGHCIDKIKNLISV